MKSWRSSLSFLSNEFHANTFIVLSGNILVAVIGIIALPILTRIFTPEIFGQFQFILASVAVLSVFGTLQYELAIVLPSKLTESNQVIILCFGTAMVVSVIIFILFIFYGNEITAYFNINGSPYIFLVIPLLTFTTVIFNISRSALVVRKEFAQLSFNNVIQVGLFNFLAITTGLFYPELLFFILAYFVSQVITSVLAIYKKVPSIIGAFNFWKIINIANEYRRFPRITTVSVFINTISKYIPVFLFSIYYGAEILGIYMIALKLLDIPLNLVKGAITQVYYQAAANTFNRNASELLVLYKQTVKKLFLVIILPAAVLLFAGDIISRFLGPGWEQTEYILKIFLIWKFFEFLHAPISHTWSIIAADMLAFKLRLISIVARFFSIYIFRDNFELAILAFSIASAMYYFAMNVILYSLLRRK